MSAPKTLYDKIWDAYVAHEAEDGTCLLYIDRHLVHEVTSPQAFEGLRMAGRTVRAPEKTIAVPDHNVPTTLDRANAETMTEDSRIQVEALDTNAKEFGLHYYPVSDVRQGIVHIVGPEQGFTLPGTTIVCGDSHTATHGAFGAIAMPLGTSQVEHVLATQCLVQAKPKTMEIRVNGELPKGVTAKDVILGIIGKIGVDGGIGYAIEFAGRVLVDGFHVVVDLNDIDRDAVFVGPFVHDAAVLEVSPRHPADIDGPCQFEFGFFLGQRRSSRTQHPGGKGGSG